MNFMALFISFNSNEGMYTMQYQYYIQQMI